MLTTTAREAIVDLVLREAYRLSHDGADAFMSAFPTHIQLNFPAFKVTIYDRIAHIVYAEGQYIFCHQKTLEGLLTLPDDVVHIGGRQRGIHMSYPIHKDDIHLILATISAGHL